MNLLRPASALLFFALTAALMAPAGAEQVFSTVSTGPVVRGHSTAPPYPLGGIYYSPCGYGYGGVGGYPNNIQPGTFGSSGYGGYGLGRRRGIGNTTITGERFYPYDIGSSGTRLNISRGFGYNGTGYNGTGCYGNYPTQSPLPFRAPMSRPYASPRP
jgi:hypothetical protein